jgi:hypothetical protein
MTYSLFLMLGLAACGVGSGDPSAELADDAVGPPTGTLVFSGPAEVPEGELAVYTVTGAHPGETVYLGYSRRGTGVGPCAARIGWQCFSLLAPVKLATGAVADAGGTLTYDVPVGNLPVGAATGLQVVAIRGMRGVDSLLSNTVLSVVVTRVEGCMDPIAINYDPSANVDDGSCEYPVDTAPPGTPPLVIDTNLQASALAVATNRAVTATFDLPMDGDSVRSHFVITPDVVAVEPWFDVATNTVVFAPAPLAPALGLGPATPQAFLAPNTLYTVTILAGAEDVLGAALEDDYVWSFTTGVSTNELPAGLGELTSVAMLGFTVVGTAPPTSVTGDVASVGALSGFTDLGAQVSGTVYSPAHQPVPAGMLTDFDVVRADLIGRATAPVLPFSAVVAAAGPLPPGLYVSAPAVALATNMVLDAGNDRDATFIFRVTGAFSLAAGVHVTLQGGADPANVFFVSDGAVVLGANASLGGTVITPAALTLGADAEIAGGRLLTKSAALTLGAATTVSLP